MSSYMYASCINFLLRWAVAISCSDRFVTPLIKLWFDTRGVIMQHRGSSQLQCSTAQTCDIRQPPSDQSSVHTTFRTTMEAWRSQSRSRMWQASPQTLHRQPQPQDRRSKPASSSSLILTPPHPSHHPTHNMPTVTLSPPQTSFSTRAT